MRYRATIFKLLSALIAAIVVVQCGASLALAVNEGWHEAIHHHDGDEDHDCPVVQLAHGFWDAPLAPVFAVPRPPVPPATDLQPVSARTVAALFLSQGVLEHAPPARG